MAMLAFPAILLPLRQEFSASLTEITAVGTVAYLLFGVGALPSGIIAGLTNAKVMLTVFFFGVAGATALIGLSTGFPMFVIGMALLGLAASIYHVTGPTLISHFAEKAGKAFGVHGAAGAAGVTLAPLSAGLMASPGGLPA
jgi:MFS family permease